MRLMVTVRSAAFARAGLVECENLGGLFDGLAAMDCENMTPLQRCIMAVGDAQKSTKDHKARSNLRASFLSAISCVFFPTKPSAVG